MAHVIINWTNTATTTAGFTTMRGLTGRWVTLPENLPPIAYINTTLTTASIPREERCVVWQGHYSATTAAKLKLTPKTFAVKSYIAGTRNILLNASIADTATATAIPGPLKVELRYRAVGESPASVV